VWVYQLRNMGQYVHTHRGLWWTCTPIWDVCNTTINGQSESESEFLYSVLLWNNHIPIGLRYRHRQSGSTAYRLQARPAPTGPGLRLTAMLRPNLPFSLMVAKLVIKPIIFRQAVCNEIIVCGFKRQPLCAASTNLIAPLLHYRALAFFI